MRRLVVLVMATAMAACDAKEEVLHREAALPADVAATATAAPPPVDDVSEEAPASLTETMGEADDLTPITAFSSGPPIPFQSGEELMARHKAAAIGSTATVEAFAPAREAPSPAPSAAPQLAYKYEFGLEAPYKKLRALKAAHEKACQEAGSRICQIVSSGVSASGGNELNAELVIQAEPKWLAGFRQGLPEGTREAGGRVVASSVKSEDLSRSIVDTQARLKAMTTLRDRLQALLASRPGKLQDLLDLERELARVQGEIDSHESQLAVMQGRVTTSTVTISYFSKGLLEPEGLLSPLGEAFTEFAGLLIGTVAFLIKSVAVVVPVSLALAAVWWLAKRLIPGLAFWRRKKRLSENPSKSPPAP